MYPVFGLILCAMRVSFLLFASGALSLAQAVSGGRIVRRDAIDAEAMYGGGIDVFLLLMLVVASVVSAAVLIAAGVLLLRDRLGVSRALLYLCIVPILVRSVYGRFISVIPNDGGPFPAWAVVAEVVAGIALVMMVITAAWSLPRARWRPVHPSHVR